MENCVGGVCCYSEWGFVEDCVNGEEKPKSC